MEVIMGDLAIVEKRLSTSQGVELSSFSEVETLKNKLFVYNGFHVLLYIRDQNINKEGKQFEYKYHICSCKTIEEMKRADRYARYVVSTRKDGLFLVNEYDLKKGSMRARGKIVKMKVCKNCLLELNYHGYKSYKDMAIYNVLNLAEFYKEYKIYFKEKPKYSDVNSPPNEYNKHFEVTSYSFRAINQWKCSKCKIDLQNDKKFLDTHHIDGVKSNDTLDNLDCLCVRCHAEQPYHAHLMESERYLRFLEKYV